MTDQLVINPIDLVLATLERTIGYAEALLKDVDPGTFAHLPLPNFNHPAFCFGHLALYPNRWLEFLGRGDEVHVLPFDADPYLAGAECVEQDGRYASMEVITTAFFESHRNFAELAPGIDPLRFADEIPEGNPYRPFFGLVGNAVTFMACSHTMMHLGQISMWRRAMGLGPCM